jgi:hypothetical protein
LLGPIFHEFYHRLWLYQHAFATRDAVTLFVARGGLRLQYGYECFLARHRLAPPVPFRSVYLSRLAAAKGTLAANPTEVIPRIVREFARGDLAELLRCVAPEVVAGRDISAWLGQPAARLEQLYLSATDEFGAELRRYFAEQGKLLADYLAQVAPGTGAILLVDTGWEGSTQALLMQVYPQREWFGLYFGRWNHRGNLPAHFGSVVGVAVDSMLQTPEDPRSSIFEYHHLIEGPLEVGMPSVTGFVRGHDGRAAPDSGYAEAEWLAPQPGENLWAGIIDYLESAAVKLDPASVARRARFGYRALARAIRRPSARMVDLLGVAQRSEDFGRAGANSILRPTVCGSTAEKVRNCQWALWRQGQVRREFGARASLYFWGEAWRRQRARWAAGLRRLGIASGAAPRPTSVGNGTADPVLLDLCRRVRRGVLRHRLNGAHQVAVFGASPYGDAIVDLLRAEGVPPSCFYDNSEAKVGTVRHGLPVRKPQADGGIHVFVITSIAGREAIGRQLTQLHGARAIVLLP